MTETMQAVRIARFGGPEVLESVELPRPEPGPGEALVRLAVAGINYSDINWREGKRDRTLPVIDGSEGAGTIAALGPGVTGLAEGERVAYWNTTVGSYAQYAICPAFRAVKLPARMDFITGAALMLQGFTAHYLVRSTFPIQDGQSLLFHAGAGGVGQIVIQIAKARGTRVLTTVGSEEKAARAKELGADETILYEQVDFAQAVRELTGGEGVNVAYDAVGAATWEGSIKSVKTRGMVVYFGAASGPVPVFDTTLLNTSGSLAMARTTLKDYVATADEIAWRAGELFDLWEEGKLVIHQGGTYPLAEAARAHADLQGRRTTGKLVLDTS